MYYFSTYTVLILLIPFRTKPRPSKKVHLDKAAEENVTLEPDKIPDPEEPIRDDVLNDPPPQDHDFVTEEIDIDTTGPFDQPTSPVWIDRTISPLKQTDKPTTPVRAREAKDDDVVITSIGHTEPSNPVALSKHSAKEEFTAIGKGKWNAALGTYSALNPQDLHSGYLNRLYTAVTTTPVW